MQISSANWTDVQKYYQDSYVKFDREYGDKLHYIYKVRLEGVLYRDSDNKEGILYMDHDNPYELEYIMPHKSMFQHGANCFLLTRVPAKQYSRGLTNTNCHFQWVDPLGKWRPADFDWSVLNAYTNKPAFRSIADCVRDPAGRSSEALSKRLAIAGSLLFCDTFKIGRVDSVKKNLHVVDLFRAEVEKLLETTHCKPFFNKIEVYK